MSQISVAEAAKLAGRDRKTLYRDIKSGKLSATTSATGLRQIDVAELSRVYGALILGCDSGDSRQGVSMPQNETSLETLELQHQLAASRAEIANLRERLGDKERHIEDMRNSLKLLEGKSRLWWQFWK